MRIALTLLWLLATASVHLAADLVKTLDVRYAEVPPGVEANLLALDIYSPKGAVQLPVMIYVHGGGWRKGDKSEVDVKPGYFSARGFVFVSINYRLLPGVDLMTQLQDSANAIGWVRRQIAAYGGDPAQLHLIGHSAGAHHVALLATNEHFLARADVALDCLKSVVELDVLALDVPKVMSSDHSPVRVQTFGREEAQWRRFSPLHQVAKGKGVPPFLLIVANGSAPKLEQAAALQKTLQTAGVRCELFEAPQHDHNSLNRAIGVREDAVTRAMERFHDSLLVR